MQPNTTWRAGGRRRRLNAELNHQAKASTKGPEDSPAAVPHLIIVTGRPASGKTTLANWLAQELRIPVVRFRALIARYHPKTIQIVCNADGETLFERFRARAASGDRHPGHGDEAVFDRLRSHLAQEQSPILDIGGVIVEVDTTNFAQIDYEGLGAQVKSLLARE
jgi:hypothetical protein